MELECGHCGSELEVDNLHEWNSCSTLTLTCPECRNKIGELQETADELADINRDLVCENDSNLEYITDIEERLEVAKNRIKELEEFIDNYIDEEPPNEL